MNSQQKQELISFFKDQNIKETLQGVSFRLLCFRYNRDQSPKEWISFEQGENASFEAILCVGNYKFDMSMTIQNVITELEK